SGIVSPTFDCGVVSTRTSEASDPSGSPLPSVLLAGVSLGNSTTFPTTTIEFLDSNGKPDTTCPHPFASLASDPEAGPGDGAIRLTSFQGPGAINALGSFEVYGEA